MNTEQDMNLIECYLSGRASAEEVKALESRLSADAELRRDFLRYAHVDAALKTMVRPVAQQPLTAPKVKTTVWRAQTVRWAAAAAILLLAGALAFWMPRGVEVLVLDASDDAASIWQKDSTQRLREVKLDHGSVQLRLDSGVTLDLSAPVHLQLADAMHASLLAGSVTADVGESGKGFVIETASACVVDLGTRFGVSMGNEGETDVAVFQGKVEVFGKKDREPTPLTTGEAVRVHPSGTPRRLVCINTRGESFATLAPPPPNALVTDVSDNVEDGGSYAFYTLQSGQMRPGARPYSTLGRPRWQPMIGAAFPAELIGADIVGTFSPDRNDPDLELMLTVSRPCAVYVMLDARAEVPDWVRRDFVEAGFQLRSGPWPENPVVQGMTADETGAIHVTYTAWKREVSAAGIVKLGAPYPEKDGRHRAMYGIVVQASGLPR